MPLPPVLTRNLALPVIGSPLFIISNPELVIAQCKAGIIGSFPALNARPAGELDGWLGRITDALAAHDEANPRARAAPFAVNQICHKSNDRLAHDVEACARYKVPIVITSLRAPREVVDAVHSWGGIVLHDVASVRHAEKALEEGADGLIAVAAGAGGHASLLSPFALVQEIRSFWNGPLALSGSIATGRAVLAALVMGADLAYLGSLFIATAEANASGAYKQGIVEGRANDIVYSNLFTGVHGNYLRRSIIEAGLDPNDLPQSDPSKMDFGSGGNTDAKVWRDIWGCGQGIGVVDRVATVAETVSRLRAEYDAARRSHALAAAA